MTVLQSLIYWFKIYAHFSRAKVTLVNLVGILTYIQLAVKN